MEKQVIVEWWLTNQKDMGLPWMDSMMDSDVCRMECKALVHEPEWGMVLEPEMVNEVATDLLVWISKNCLGVFSNTLLSLGFNSMDDFCAADYTTVIASIRDIHGVKRPQYNKFIRAYARVVNVDVKDLKDLAPWGDKRSHSPISVMV